MPSRPKAPSLQRRLDRSWQQQTLQLHYDQELPYNYLQGQAQTSAGDHLIHTDQAQV